ncbi:MAG: acyltransferase [Hyphomicrobium sp.]|nr:acyltransferase [Hyphomicrobium sp.]
MQLAPTRDDTSVLGTSATRSAWLDYAKAIGMVLVVFGHASRSVERTDGLVWSEALRFTDGIIYAFHMPLFFILAGVASALAGSRSWQDEARAVGFGIVLPYIVWSILWIVGKSAFPGSVNTPMTLDAVLQLLWEPVEHMWFLYHLFVARVVWLLLDVTGLRTAPASGTLPLQAMLIAGAFVSAAAVYGDTHPWLMIGALICNTAMFGIGLVFGPAIVGAVMESRRTAGATVLAGSVGGFVLWNAFRPGDTSLMGDAVAILGSMAVIALAVLLPKPRGAVLRAFAFIGEISLAIYVMHPFVIGATRKALELTGVLSETSLVVSATILGLALPAIAYAAVLSATATTGLALSKWMGLGARTRSHYIPLVLAARSAPA